MGKADPALQRLLLNPLQYGSFTTPNNAFKIQSPLTQVADSRITPHFGTSALRFYGMAEQESAKGNFKVTSAFPIPGTVHMLGLWVYLEPDANVDRVGIEVDDSSGKAFQALIPADWTGWKWVEADLSSPDFLPSSSQADGDPKDQKVALPLRDVCVVWRTKKAGATGIVVNALCALTDISAAAPPLPLAADFVGTTIFPAGTPLSALLNVTNFQDKAAAVTVEYSVQHDSAMFDLPPPDPVYGSDRALGAKSWTEAEGKHLDEGTLTDGKKWTFSETPGISNHWVEAFQYIDLGKALQIKRLDWDSGDANHLTKVDVSSSLDGDSYTPIDSLQGFDLHKKWGVNTFPLTAPLTARFLKFRYHQDGARLNSIAMPEEVGVYDGIENEQPKLPEVGRMVAADKLTANVPPHAFSALPITGKDPLPTGSYLVAAKVQAGDKTYLTWNHLFVSPAPYQATEKSRFGINAGSTGTGDSLQQLGVGWARYENMKWPHVSSQPGVYDYTGGVGARIDEDAIFQNYLAHGMHTLPFLFLFPSYLSGPPTADDKDPLPEDTSLFADFAFQTAARYGSVTHPPEELKSTDKKSGLNLIHYYEIWNEENNYGFKRWHTAARYYEMFRAAAEAVKKADPSALVTNGGFSGIGVQLVDTLRSYKYADGKSPLDFVDVLNVHFYTGQNAPEVCRLNANTGTFLSVDPRTFEENLALLRQWRDQNKPGLPIWMTETGYETNYIYFVDERTQAAWLVRDLLLCLANGIDKVMVFRETGSDNFRWGGAGVMNSDGTPKPSFFSYATLIREFDGVEGDGQRIPTGDDNVRVYAWKQGAATVLTAWTVEGTAPFPLNLGAASVTDTFGDRQDKVDTGTLTLTPFPVYIRDYADAAPLAAALAQGAQLEEKRKAGIQKQNALKAYLYGFGNSDVGGYVVGGYRPYTPVLAEEAYDATKGYGFNPVALGDEDIRRNDPMNQHAVKVDKGIQFDIHADAGTYQLQVGAVPLNHGGHVTVTGSADGAKGIDIPAGSGEGEVEVRAGSEPIGLEFDQKAELRWVHLIQKEADAN